MSDTSPWLLVAQAAISPLAALGGALIGQRSALRLQRRSRTDALEDALINEVASFLIAARGYAQMMEFLPLAMSTFSTQDWTEFLDTDSGVRLRTLADDEQQALQRARLRCPRGALRDALTAYAAMPGSRDHVDSDVEPLYSHKATPDEKFQAALVLTRQMRARQRTLDAIEALASDRLADPELKTRRRPRFPRP